MSVIVFSDPATAPVRAPLPAGRMPETLAVNLSRDLTWPVVSALNIDLAGRAIIPLDQTSPLLSQITSSSFLQPMEAQWLFGTIPMVVLAVSEIVYRKAQGQEVPYAKIAAPVVAASLAIPTWDLGQTIGTHLGTTSGCSLGLWHGASIAGGMIAAPFTGMFEGFTQWGVKYLFNFATESTLREQWSTDWFLMAKLFLKEFLLNITIGAIPGAVWQIVYFFVLPAFLAIFPPGWAILCTALLVGLAVMLCNLICTYAINAASVCIDKALGWDKQLEDLNKKIQQQLEQQQSQSRAPQEGAQVA